MCKIGELFTLLIIANQKINEATIKLPEEAGIVDEE